MVNISFLVTRNTSILSVPPPVSIILRDCLPGEFADSFSNLCSKLHLWSLFQHIWHELMRSLSRWLLPKPYGKLVLRFLPSRKIYCKHIIHRVPVMFQESVFILRILGLWLMQSRTVFDCRLFIMFTVSRRAVQ
jgi:hypothetical protein